MKPKERPNETMIKLSVHRKHIKRELKEQAKKIFEDIDNFNPEFGIGINGMNKLKKKYGVDEE